MITIILTQNKQKGSSLPHNKLFKFQHYSIGF